MITAIWALVVVQSLNFVLIAALHWASWERGKATRELQERHHQDWILMRAREIAAVERVAKERESRE